MIGEGAAALLALYGVLLGARHSLEPDHLTAVSTMAAHGSSRTDVLRISAAWGAGHATLLIVAGIVVTMLRWRISPAVFERADWLVGFVLIGMGLWTFWGLRRNPLHVHAHTHGTQTVHTHFHRHPHGDEHDHPPSPSWIRRPVVAYLVGTLHGLAGSGAATALAVLVAPSPKAAALYLLSFAIGSLGGMVAVGVLAMWPIMQASSRIPRARRLVQGLAGTGSVIVGLLLIGNVL